MTLRKRLVQLDVDSTFIQEEVIDLLADAAGVFQEVSRITESAMRGEIDFEASLRKRVALLKGLSFSTIEQVRLKIHLTDGVSDLVKELHKGGHEVALVSGGFIDVIEPLIQEHRIKYFKANKLEIVDGYLTGQLLGPIIDRAAKAAALREFATAAQVLMQDTVAIGDGANDVDMVVAAGLGIAFNAKPILVQVADHHITEKSLKTALGLIERG